MPCRTPNRRKRCASRVFAAARALAAAAVLLALADSGAVIAQARVQSLEALGFRPFLAEPSPRLRIELRRTVRPADALPDGRPAFGFGRIAEAWLIDPTERDGGGVLGDGVEAGGLMVRLRGGGERRLLLPEDQVFVDLQPRLADLDGGGEDEILVVRMAPGEGAVLTAYGLVDGELRLVAEGPRNLQAGQWLNPIGAADFDGDGVVEVAYVESPHQRRGILRIVSLQDGRLVEEASRAGYANHVFGSREQGLSAILDFDEDGLPEIFLPSARRRALHVLRYQDGEITLLGRELYDAQIIGDFRLEDLDGNGMDEVIYQLDDGLEVRLYR